MRKRILIISIIIAALIGVYFGITKLNLQKEEEEALPKEIITIFKTEKENIALMNISTPEYKYSFCIQQDKWAVSGSEEIKLYNVRVDNLAYDFASINAETIIEEAADYSAFGFENPVGTPSVTLKDGSEKKFIIGNKTPTGGSYYFKTTDGNEIYTVYSTKIESFIAPLDTYRDQTLAKINTEEISEIQIKRNDADIILRLKSEQEMQQGSSGLNPWKMISPYRRDVSGHYFEENLIEKVADITISKFVDDKPVSYTEYGLDAPKYTISFTESDKPPVTILIGNETEDGFYVKTKNEPAVYIVSRSAFEYRDINPMLLIDTLLYIQMIDTVDAIALSVDNTFYDLKIERQSENTLYFINGKEANESAFKKAYQEIIGLTLRGVVTEAPQGESVFKAIYKFNDGRTDDVVEGVTYQDRYVAIKINGKAEYYVLKDQVLKMTEKVRQFSENPSSQ